MANNDKGSERAQNPPAAYIPPDLHDVGDTDFSDELRERYTAGVTENGVTFKLGEITNFVADAIVCPWVSERPEDSYYSQKVCNAADPGLHDELEAVWPSPRVPTQSILTGNHGINTCKHIIHVREPLPTYFPVPVLDQRPYWSPSKTQPLKDTINACLIMAVSLNCKTIAIPPIGIRSVYKPVKKGVNPPAGGIPRDPEPEPTNPQHTETDRPPPGTRGSKHRPIRRWQPERASQAVLEAVGEFRAKSPFRDRLEEIIFLFEDVNDWNGEELGSYRRDRAWAVEWEEPWKVPRLLVARHGEHERDQRESELTGSDSPDSNLPSDSSVFESDHESDNEPEKPMLPERLPLAILNHVYQDIPVPLGVYVQFKSLFIPNRLALLDQYQPAVYGYIRYAPVTTGSRYDGWEIDISRTGRKGRWVLGARIGNRTMDDRLIGRPLDRDDNMISLDDPRLRFRPAYNSILNPNVPETRQEFIKQYLRHFQQIDYIRMHRRWVKRQNIGLKARHWRHEKARRWRRLDRRRAKRMVEREDRNDNRQDRRERQTDRREKGEDVKSVVSDDERSTQPDSPPVQWLRGPMIGNRRNYRWENFTGQLRTKELRTESSPSSRELSGSDEG